MYPSHIKIYFYIQYKFLKSDSQLPKKLSYLVDWKPFKNDEKSFLFDLKGSFRSQDIWVFDTNLWSCRKNDLIRNIKLTSKFIVPQPGLQTVSIHVLPNVSQSQGNQTMKFGQLIEYNKKNIFFRNSMENGAGTLL